VQEHTRWPVKSSQQEGAVADIVPHSTQTATCQEAVLRPPQISAVNTAPPVAQIMSDIIISLARSTVKSSVVQSQTSTPAGFEPCKGPQGFCTSMGQGFGV
jgi:hypothetical protein